MKAIARRITSDALALESERERDQALKLARRGEFSASSFLTCAAVGQRWRLRRGSRVDRVTSDALGGRRAVGAPRSAWMSAGNCDS
jgi:hypothetical protein